jgi:alditol oxidase
MTSVAGHNWSSSLVYSAENVVKPTDVEQVRKAVVRHARVKGLGSRHSFSHVADTDGCLIDLSDMPSHIELNSDQRTVTVSAGVRYGELAQRLHAQGWALHNLASLPHISVVGAVATGTHGSGARNGSLATAVTAMQYIDAQGNLNTIKQGDEHFNAMVVHAGALAVVTAVTLRIQPSYEMRQYVHRRTDLEHLAAHLPDVLSSAYSVSVFTDWQTANVWGKALAEQDYLGAGVVGTPTLSTPAHPIDGVDPRNCTEQLGIVGPWHERLPHFKYDFMPSSGKEIQSEYFVAMDDAERAVAAVMAIGEYIRPTLLVSELRAVAADELWLSGSYRQDVLAIHFTWKMDMVAVQAAASRVEQALKPFGARPHWGKVFFMDRQYIHSVSPRAAEFASLRRALDPEGRFDNEFLQRYL